MRRSHGLALLLTALALIVPRWAEAYAVRIHELFPLRCLPPSEALDRTRLSPVSSNDLDAFRGWLDSQFRNHPDPGVRQRYVTRWPTAASFDRRAFKRLMSWNLQKEVNGVDQAQGLPCTARQAISVGSGQSDTDWRNRERVALDAQGQPLRLPDGREVPADPLILNMGRVRGLSSQANAHYGLADVPLSAEPEVLKTDPRRFAMAHSWPAGPVRTFAREMCQLHFDLAVLARAWGTPAGLSLSHLFLGQGYHYLQDVGNQVHTVQVGYYDFFVKAKLLTWARALVTGGGYFGDLAPFEKVGVELLTTHHVVSENLNAKRIDEVLANGLPPAGPIREAMEGLTQDDPALAASIDEALGDPVPGTASARPEHAAAPTLRQSEGRAKMAALVTDRLIEASSHEGADVYRHMAGALHGRMSRYGVVIDSEEGDPDKLLADTSDPAVKAHLEALYGLHAKAYRRVGTAMRRLHARYVDLAGVDVSTETARAFAAGLLADRLDELDGEERRLSQYMKNPPPAGQTTVKQPAWLIVPLLLVVALGRRWRRLARTSDSRPEPTP